MADYLFCRCWSGYCYHCELEYQREKLADFDDITGREHLLPYVQRLQNHPRKCLTIQSFFTRYGKRLECQSLSDRSFPFPLEGQHSHLPTLVVRLL